MFKKPLALSLIFALTACSMGEVTDSLGIKKVEQSAIKIDQARQDFLTNLPDQTFVFRFAKTPALEVVLQKQYDQMVKLVKDLVREEVLPAGTQELIESMTYEGLPLKELAFGIHFLDSKSENIEENICVKLRVDSQSEMVQSMVEGFSDGFSEGLSAGVRPLPFSPVLGSLPQIDPEIPDAKKMPDFVVSKEGDRLEYALNCPSDFSFNFAALGNANVVVVDKGVSALANDRSSFDGVEADERLVKILEAFEAEVSQLNFNRVNQDLVNRLYLLEIQNSGYKVEQIEQYRSEDLRQMRADFLNGKAQSESYYLHKSASFDYEVSQFEVDNQWWLQSRFEYSNLNWTHVFGQLQKQGVGGYLTSSVLVGVLGTVALSTFDGYFKKARDSQRMSVVRNTATLLKTARAVDSLEGFDARSFKDFNNNGLFDTEDIAAVLMEEGAYALPEPQEDRCYFYAFEKDNDQDFAVFVSGEEASWRGLLKVDGTSEMVMRLQAELGAKEIRCEAPQVVDIEFLNLSFGDQSQEVVSGAVMEENFFEDLETEIQVASSFSVDRIERVQALDLMSTYLSLSKESEAVSGFNHSGIDDTDADGALSSADLKDVFMSEFAYEVPSEVDQRCYFYVAHDTNADEFAVFAFQEDGVIEVRGTDRMTVSVEKLLGAQDVYCNTPKIRGAQVLNLNR